LGLGFWGLGVLGYRAARVVGEAHAHSFGVELKQADHRRGRCASSLWWVDDIGVVTQIFFTVKELGGEALGPGAKSRVGRYVHRPRVLSAV